MQPDKTYRKITYAITGIAIFGIIALVMPILAILTFVAEGSFPLAVVIIIIGCIAFWLAEACNKQAAKLSQLYIDELIAEIEAKETNQ